MVTKGFWTRKSKADINLHGSARFANKKEIKKTSLLKNEGVYVGAWEDEKHTIHYLQHNGPEHVLVFAPTRSGKGVGLVIPTLLSWQHSSVVLDIKGENWALTSGWRSKYANNKVLKFDPTSPDGSSVKFNPLQEIRLGSKYEVADVQNLVTMIVDPDGKGLNDHWAKTGHALLTGALIHLMYIAKEKEEVPTLKGLAHILSDPETPIEELFSDMMSYTHKEGKTHPVVASCARTMLNKAENEQSGVLSTALSFLELYRDDIVAENTAYSEFKIRDLMNNDQPVSLYLVIPPNNLDRLKPLIRLVINQIMRILTEKMEFEEGKEKKGYKHRLLMLLDEFPALGRLEIFEQSMAFIAGYGIKSYLITQDLTQLYKAYGQDESIISNCHIRIAYAPNKVQTAKLLSEMTGTTTVVKHKVSTSGKRFSLLLKQVSEDKQEVSRPLMTTDECMRLPGPEKDSKGNITKAGDMLIFVTGNYPIYGTQILYFLDDVFLARRQVKPPINSNSLINKEV